MANPMPGNSPDVKNLESNMSVFNPTDIASMMAPGTPGSIDPQRTTVGEFFARYGVSFEDPLAKLAAVFSKQADNADPLKKMNNLAAGAQGGPMPRGGGGMPSDGRMPGGTPSNPQAAGPAPGLDELTRMLGG